MHIAIDARYVRDRPSGIGTYARAIVERAPGAAPDDRFTFWAHPQAHRPLSTAANARDVTIAPGPSSPLTTLWPARYFDFAGVDVFHSPHNMLPRGVPCASVVTVQDVLALEHPSWDLRWFERLFRWTYYPQAIWRALRRATRVIVTTHATADRVRALAPEALPRLHVIPLAPDADLRPAADPEAARARAAQLLGVDAPYVLVVGANTPAKGHPDAIAAFAAATEAPWLLVLQQRRGAADRSLLSLARRLHVDDRIVWLPAIARADQIVLMQSAALLLQPSLYEGFGLPVVEAFACGCPVVASDIPALREVAGGAAVLVPPADAATLAGALRDLIRSPQRRAELAARGGERARDFSWDRCVRETVETYRIAAETIQL